MDHVYSAYAAGLFDGEGNLHIQEHRRKDRAHTYSISMGIANTKRDVLDEFCSVWGGRVRQVRTSARGVKDCFYWRMGGSDGYFFLMDVMPYLRIKRAEAAVALAFITLPSSPKYREQRIKLRHKMLHLNRVNGRGLGDGSSTA